MLFLSQENLNYDRRQNPIVLGSVISISWKLVYFFLENFVFFLQKYEIFNAICIVKLQVVLQNIKILLENDWVSSYTLQILRVLQKENRKYVCRNFKFRRFLLFSCFITLDKKMRKFVSLLYHCSEIKLWVITFESKSYSFQVVSPFLRLEMFWTEILYS